MPTWDEIRQVVLTTCDVEKDLGGGFILRVEGVLRSHAILAALNNPGFGSDDYVTFESFLGTLEECNLVLAARAGNKLLGGVVLDGTTLSLRESRALATIDAHQIGIALARLAGSTEGYLVALEA